VTAPPRRPPSPGSGECMRVKRSRRRAAAPPCRRAAAPPVRGAGPLIPGAHVALRHEGAGRLAAESCMPPGAPPEHVAHCRAAR